MQKKGKVLFLQVLVVFFIGISIGVELANIIGTARTVSFLATVFMLIALVFIVIAAVLMQKNRKPVVSLPEE